MATTDTSIIESYVERSEELLPEERVPDKPFGPVAAAFISAGIGAFVFGVLTLVSELSASFGTAITITKPVGPLSGKVIWAMAAYALSWIVSGFALRGRDFSPKVAYLTTAVLFAAAYLLTFPPVWRLFGAG